MAAAQYDLTLEQGATFAISFRWVLADGNATPISLAGRTPYMSVTRSGIILLDSGSVGGITLVKEPSATTGRIDVTISGTATRKLLRPFEETDGARYLLSITDPGDAGNTVHLVQGLVLIDEESV